MKIKSYIYSFVALAVVGCSKGETQGVDATEEGVEVQFSMGTKAGETSDNPLTYRFLATTYSAGTNTYSYYQMAGTYRGLFTGETSDYLIPCAVDDAGVLTDAGAYDSSCGLYPALSSSYSLTAVSPAIAQTTESIQPTEDGATYSTWGVTMNREVTEGSEVYIATIPTINIDGTTIGGGSIYYYDWATPLQEPRATLTLTAEAVTTDYHIKSITYKNVASKAQFHPKSGFVVDYEWYNDFPLFTSDNASDDLDIMKDATAVTVPYYSDETSYTKFPILAMDYSAESNYYSAPQLVVEFNIYNENTDEITNTREAVVILSRDFSYQTHYTLKLSLVSMVLSVSIAANTIEGWYELGSGVSGSVGGENEYWEASVDLSDGDWDIPTDGDITGTIN